MPYAKLNASGCEIRKERIKLRLDLFLNPADPNYDKHHLYVVDWDSPEVQAGYSGEVDETGTPLDMAAYQAWEDNLPHIWVNTPFHSHMIHPAHTASDDDIKSDITRCLGYFYAFKQHCWDSEVRFIDEWKKVAFQDGEVRHRFVAGKPKDKKKNADRLANILSRISEFDVGISTPSGHTDLRIGKKGTITIGSAATDRGSFFSLSTNNAVSTLLNNNGAADGDGTIDTVEAYFNQANSGNNFRVGIFYDHESNNYYTCKDVENLGEVVAGYQEFTGLSLTCLTGEYIGADGTTGGDWLKIDRDTSGGVNCQYDAGDANCVVDDYSQYASSLASAIISLYGTGNGAEPITLELRSATDTDARLLLDTGITLALRSATPTDARLTISVAISVAGRAYSQTRAAIVLATGVSIALRSSTGTRAAITLTLAEATELELRSATDTRADSILDTGIALSLRSLSDTRADLTLDTLVGLALRSFTSTRAALTISVTAVTELYLRSFTDTRAAITLDTLVALAFKSVTDTRATLALSGLIVLELRSSTATRAAIVLTISLLTEIECRSATATRAAIQLNSLITLALLSQTSTRAALLLTTAMRQQTLNMELHDRQLTMAMRGNQQ